MVIRFFNKSYLSSAALLFVTVLLPGCADEINIDEGSEGFIRFNVSISNETSSIGDTRGVDVSTGILRSLMLQGDGSTLYLHPKTIDGIVTDSHSSSGRNSEDSKSTRASITSTDNLESFGVYASLRSSESEPVESLEPDYMNNVFISRDNNWSPTSAYLWPGKGMLHLNAYSPYTSAPDTEGLTALPAKGPKGTLELSFSTPKSVEDQFDLLVSNPVDASSSPCDITFRHALTAIRFEVGQKLVPCTVKEISISGVASKGMLDMESGLWSSITDKVEFSITPDVSLKSENGAKYVTPGTDITTEGQTFILIPQTLSEDAKMKVVLSFDDEDMNLEVPLGNVTWEAGKTAIYRLSANPVSDSYILEITDEEGNPISSLSTDYTGSELSFKVRSVFGQPDNTNEQRNIAWKAEFVDDGGNVISRPEWISNWSMSGAGSADLKGLIKRQTPVFEGVSEYSQKLRETPNINTSSGYHPYNLASASGRASVENTANCYLVHAPGFYSLPLVYGNAIADSKTNVSAYSTTASSNVHILKNFVNHLGDPITDPYIYNNSGCNPEDAVLIWEGRLNLIQNVSLSPDKKRLTFQISPDYICQGNAIVAVRDKQGVILWSWHIWVTPYNPDEDPIVIAYHGKNYEMMSLNLGQITTGDRVNFASRSVKIRYSQISETDVPAETLTIMITQRGKITATPDSYNYYQWGRKDPMISGIEEWYAGGSAEVTKIWTKNYETERTPDIPIIADFIRTPGYFWVTSNSDNVFPYYNLWNTNNSTTEEVKTIYDPSPKGYMVARNVLTGLNGAECVPASGIYGNGVNVTVPTSGQVIFFPTHGYRDSNDGMLMGATSGNEYGSVWTSRTTSTSGASALEICVKAAIVSLQGSDPRFMGFGVRSTKEL